MLIHISTIVENHPTQIVFNGYRKAQLGIQYEQLYSTHRNTDVVVAVGCAGARRTHRHQALRTRPVDRKSAQRVTSAGEEALACRHPAAGKRRCQSYLNSVRPHHLLEGEVICLSPQKSYKVGA